MATPKSFRLSDNALRALSQLKDANPTSSETHLVETALLAAAARLTTPVPTTLLYQLYDALSAIDNPDDQLQYCTSALAECLPY